MSSFSIGRGTHMSIDGVIVRPNYEWSNVAFQDVLPSFAFVDMICQPCQVHDRLVVRRHHDDSFDGGCSLRVCGKIGCQKQLGCGCSNQQLQIRLYRLAIPLDDIHVAVSVTLKAANFILPDIFPILNGQVITTLADTSTTAASGWIKMTWLINVGTANIDQFGIAIQRSQPNQLQDVDVLIGQILITNPNNSCLTHDFAVASIEVVTGFAVECIHAPATRNLLLRLLDVNGSVVRMDGIKHIDVYQDNIWIARSFSPLVLLQTKNPSHELCMQRVSTSGIREPLNRCANICWTI
jgi:hypothetical protein